MVKSERTVKVAIEWDGFSSLCTVWGLENACKVLFIVVGIMLPVCLALTMFPLHVMAEPDNRVALLVVLEDDTQLTRCVTFGEAEISGEDVLDRSGLNVVSDFDPTQGAAVCAIEGVGCGAENCFCECQGATCVYWSYWLQQDGDWVYSGKGTSNAFVQDGDIQAWVWGTGQDDPPPEMAFDDICEAESDSEQTPAPDVDDPTNTPQATATPQADVEFWVDDTNIEAGTCTILNWYAAHIKALYLDGQAVVGEGAETVCPCTTTAYVMNIIFLDGSGETITRTVNVTGACGDDSPIATPRAPTATRMASPTPTEGLDKFLPTATPRPLVPPTATDIPLPTASPFPTLSPLPTASPLPTVTPRVSPTPQAVTPTLTLSPTLGALTGLTVTGLITPARLAVQGDVSAPAAFSASEWVGYLVFGVLLVTIGVTHLIIQRRSVQV